MTRNINPIILLIISFNVLSKLPWPLSSQAVCQPIIVVELLTKTNSYQSQSQSQSQ